MYILQQLDKIKCNKNKQVMLNHQQLYHHIRQQTYRTFYQHYFNKFTTQQQPSTVLCSFWIGQRDDDNEDQGGMSKGDIVAVGFGTKSLPYLVAKEYQGRVVKDMHAQVLARRGLIKYLLDKLPEPGKQTNLYTWNPKRNKHSIRKQLKLILFTNQIFCGDCMTDQQTNTFSGAKPLKYFKHKAEDIPQQKYHRHCLRTKPGRLDLPINSRSLSLACSDKIALWNVLGVQGKILFNYVMPVYIDQVVIETDRKIDDQVILEGISIPMRIHQLFGYSYSKIHNKLFKIKVQGQLRYISHQFKCNTPKLSIIASEKNNMEHISMKNKQKGESEQKQKQKVKQEQQQKGKGEKEKENRKLELCGIITESKVNWLGGKTGLPEGVSLKKIGKVSDFCSESLYKKYESKFEEEFKYHAIKDRIKMLFGQWTTDFKQ